ncbi:MAG: hypothetical protein ACLP3B_09110 [Syntrophobacteraceae bacterium]
MGKKTANVDLDCEAGHGYRQEVQNCRPCPVYVPPPEVDEGIMNSRQYEDKAKRPLTLVFSEGERSTDEQVFKRPPSVQWGLVRVADACFYECAGSPPPKGR